MDVERLRSDTPGCERRVHLNNAGAALMPAAVHATVVGHLAVELSLGGYEAAAAAADRHAAIYDSIATLVGARPSEIALVDNATRAFNAVLYALPFVSGQTIVTGRAEYASNYMGYLRLARTHGIEVVVAPDDAHGQVDVAALADRVDSRTALIALTQIPTGGGLVNPVAAVGAIARQAGVPFLLDATQAVGQLPTRVDELGCDFLAATGRKFLRGPRGTGFLYARAEWAERLHPVTLDVAAADWTADGSYTLAPGARRFEVWEASVALQLGLGQAVDYALAVGLDAIWERVRGLAAQLRAGVAAIDGVVVHDRGVVQCAIVTFSVTGSDPAAVKRRLTEQGFHVELSHAVHSRLDFAGRGIDVVLRASPHYYNTEGELDRFIDAIRELDLNTERSFM